MWVLLSTYIATEAIQQSNTKSIVRYKGAVRHKGTSYMQKLGRILW
jgi:hypothetical protein